MHTINSLPFFNVIKAGPLTTVQDLGRFGFFRDGVPSSGAMDPLSFALGNKILGNQPNAAALEIAMNQIEISFVHEKTSFICVSGPSGLATLNGNPISLHTAISVKKEDRLILKPDFDHPSARSYLSCSGGISVPEVLGSRSTYLPGKFGGFEGRALRFGDLISRNHLSPTPKASRCRYVDSNIIRFISHSSPAKISKSWIKNYLESPWKVDSQSNRMGLRLIPGDESASVSLKKQKIPDRVLSQGTFFGVIQLTQDGTPIILGADAQTIGGYPIIACVISEDLWKCGQVMPGATIRLESFI